VNNANGFNRDERQHQRKIYFVSHASI
jgi:hypothetical protein